MDRTIERFVIRAIYKKREWAEEIITLFYKNDKLYQLTTNDLGVEDITYIDSVEDFLENLKARVPEDYQKNRMYLIYVPRFSTKNNMIPFPTPEPFTEERFYELLDHCVVGQKD